MTARARLFAFCFVVTGCVSATQTWQFTRASTQSRQQEGAVEVRSAEEVITKWRPAQHLYVKEDLGISKPQLAKLEKWLDENGPHWTVVLMRQASDETYHALDQRTFQGMDAVEYALGHGLANRTDFGGLVHPTTGETDGAVFVLFLVERKFSYYGSDLHDQRGLGESKWIGDLDREAVRAMRNGGRIVDAVKNTVTAINKRVERQLRSEKLAQERAKVVSQRAELKRRRELEFLGARLKETAEQMLPRIEESARQIRAAFPEAAASKLAGPPVELWKKRLVDLHKDLANVQVDGQDPYQQSPQFRQLVQQTNQLRGEIDHYLDLYAAHKSFGEILSPVEQRLDLIADHPSGAAIQSSDEAYRILEEARNGHARGEVVFVDHIQRVEDLVDQGEQAIRLDQQRIKEEAEKARLIRRTLSIVASVLAAGLLGLLWLLNLRRRPALRRAHDAFDQAGKSMEAELNNVEPIIQRGEQVIGTKAAFSQMGFAGQTLELGTRALENVQLLEDMGEEANSVIATAYRLMHPSNPVAEAANMVSAARYEHCVRLLSGQSLRARSDIASSEENANARQAAWKSFGEFFTDLRRVGGETNALLDTLDEGLTQLSPRIDALQSNLDAAVELEQELASASRLDRYFRVPAFFDNLIPAAQQDCERASLLAGKDPVLAVNQFVPDGVRKISDGIAIASSIQKGRSEVFPQLDTAGDELKSLGFDIRWIEQRVLQLGDRADQLLVDASTREMGDEIRQFDGDLMQLGLRARRAVELANNITNNVSPSLDQLAQEILAARRSVSQKLQIDESSVLHEVDYDPDVELGQASNQLQSARASLDYGGVESVMESLEVLEIEASTARNLVENSVVAVNDFSTDHQTTMGRQSELADRSPHVRSLIVERQAGYADSALVFRDRDESGTDDVPAGTSETVVSRMAKADQIVTNAVEANKQSQELHYSGRVLQAANLLHLTQADLAAAAMMFDEILEHCTWLDNQTQENTLELNRRLSAVATVKSSADDPRTQRPSGQLFEELGTATQTLQQDFEVSSRGRDPFLDQQRLQELAMQTEELMLMIGADWRAHAAATRAVEGAVDELKAAKQSVSRSLADQIPDSQTIKQCQGKVANLETELTEVGRRLQTSHDDWREVGQQADALLAELGVVDGQLRRELELAQDAVRELQSASAQVFDAASWRGSYGIKIIGNPGSEELYHARRSLAEGEYLAAIDYCRSAEFHAKRAIDVARSQVRQKQQDIARIAAAARRRRQSSMSFGGFSGGSSFGSRSSSSSWSSSSRSSSSSSSRSSGGSGFSRSGW